MHEIRGNEDILEEGNHLDVSYPQVRYPGCIKHHGLRAVAAINRLVLWIIFLLNAHIEYRIIEFFDVQNIVHEHVSLVCRLHLHPNITRCSVFLNQVEELVQWVPRVLLKHDHRAISVVVVV